MKLSYPIDNRLVAYYTVLVDVIQRRTEGGEILEIVVSNKTSRPLYEQIATQIKTQIMSGDLKAGEALPSIRALAKSLHISVLTVQKAYDLLQTDGFIETTAGKGCYVSVQNQDFYLEEQQKKAGNPGEYLLRASCCRFDIPLGILGSLPCFYVFLFCFYLIRLDNKTDTSACSPADTTIIVVSAICFLQCTDPVCQACQVCTRQVAELLNSVLIKFDQSLMQAVHA